MNKLLDLTVAPLKREFSFDGILVFPSTWCNALQFRHALLLDSRQPGVDRFARALAQHGEEGAFASPRRE